MTCRPIDPWEQCLNAGMREPDIYTNQRQRPCLPLDFARLKQEFTLMHQLGRGDPWRDRRAKHSLEASNFIDREKDESFPFLLQTDQDVTLNLT